MNETIDLQKLIIEGIENRKGKDITIVDMSHIDSAPTPMFIIANGTSSMQVGSIADSVGEHVQEQSGAKPYNYDGYTNSEWIVIDYGSILVHIFLPTTRERYNLEELWSDAIINHLPDLD